MRHLTLLQHVVEVARSGSIRKAAERLNITSSALNRRVQDLEEELGTPLFERRARGVSLTTAGEMFVSTAQHHLSEMERLRSQIEELRGLRRGVVRIACSQALAQDFLATQIAAFQKDRPKVAFELKVTDHETALAALRAYDVDLALVFHAVIGAGIAVAARLPQRLAAIMRADHPLAAQRTVRLAECASYPVALPDRTLGSRQLIDQVASRQELRFQVAAESGSFEMLRGIVMRGNAISFQIEIGAPPSDVHSDVVARQIDDRDVPQADLSLCLLRGRSLSVAAALFIERLAQAMQVVRKVP